MRRLIDLLAAAAGIILMAPVFACVALAITATSGRPVFFCQARAGLRGAPFTMFKFRTMSIGAEAAGGSLTFRADARITPLGRFLRKTKLDELPQLLNILRGEMTLIGPRPEVLDWVARYTAEQREVLQSKPGLTDAVQLLFRHEQDFLTSAEEYERLLAIKIQRQIEYQRQRTWSSDCKIILATVRAMFPSRPSPEEIAVYQEIQAALSDKSSPSR